MIYEQENIKPNVFRRTFKSDVDSSELVWHRDKKNRIVEVLNDSDWMLQMENELPKKLKKGDLIFITKESYHRVIKGNGNLEIIIREEKSIKVPKNVINVIRRGSMYSNRSGKTNTKIQDILDNEEVDYDTVLEFKKYFDSKRNNITLNESFKGKPHQDSDYIEWLLRGGEMGQKWVLKVVREQKLLKKF